MTTRWRIAAVVVGIFALAVLTMPQAAVAGGNMVNGSHNRYAAGGVCKSGKHVDNTKLCKENGGKY